MVSLRASKNRNEFNSVLEEVSALDEEFDKTNFVARQKSKYEQITSDCQKIVDQKLKEFDRLDNIEYNKKAVALYEKIFRLFSEPKNVTYYEGEILELFSYDSSRLTNETLIYYNHVYSFILSKLNENEKLSLTKLAIIAEKKA